MSSKEQLLGPEEPLLAAPDAVTHEEVASAEPATMLLLRSRSALVVLWLLSVAISVWIVGLLLQKATAEFDFSEPKLAEALAFHNEQFDVIYLGDSLTLEGVNAKAIDQNIGSHSYNFALGGASILESEMQLRYFLRRNEKPRLVVLGLYVNQENRPAGVRPSLYFALPTDLRKVYLSKLKEFEGKEVDRSFILFNSVPAYRYRNSVDLVIKSLLSPEPQRPTFVQGQAEVTFSRPVHLGPAHDSVLNLAELQSFVDYCREQKLQLLMIEPPNTVGFGSLTRNRVALLASIRRIADRNGVSFVSYGDSGDEYSPKDWVNLNHLNLSGSNKFSNLLGPIVSNALRQSQ